MLDGMKKIVSQIKNEIDIRTKHYKLGEETQLKNKLKEELKELNDEQLNDVFWLIDLCLEEEQKKRVPIQELDSVQIVKTLGIPPRHVCFYSNMYDNGIDILFSVIEECHFLSVTGSAINEKNYRYKDFEKNRLKYQKKISNFLFKEDSKK